MVLEQRFARLRSLSRDESAPTYDVRLARLKKLESLLTEHMASLAAAMDRDFGGRSLHEAETFDLIPTLAEVRAQMRDLRHFMAARGAGMPWYMRPARARVVPQPLGVVGVISPWNFPVYLALAPLASALAAGNRVMLKPSELSPHTSQLLGELLSHVFDEDELYVALGDADVAARFSALPFDHLLFTGSTEVGRKVAIAAAHNLTPVTLELGGKSPAIVAPSADVRRAARRILFGKLTNAGQICIAPDYVLAQRTQLPALIEALRAAAHAFYPSFVGNPDYTAVLSARNRERYASLLADAAARGARLIPLAASESDARAGTGQLAPTLVLDAAPDSRVLREELFLPILPIVTYDTLEDAIRYVNQRDRPLALYVFATEPREHEVVVARTVSGGVTVNDVFYHCGCGGLPFGGVGPSGMGAYHGQAGFDTFSHKKPVFYQSRLNAGGLLEAPVRPLSHRLRAFFKWVV